MYNHNCIIWLSQGRYAIVDGEDYEKLATKKWHAKITPYTVYARTSKSEAMHRVLMNAPKDLLVDHINHNGLDNRKSNLRICTKSQNHLNSHKRQNMRNKCKGVWQNIHGTWRGRVYINGKAKYTKSYRTEVEAALAYDELARQVYGEFACTNEMLGLVQRHANLKKEG